MVAREALGEAPPAGVSVVNRYNDYNRAPCSLQYCYAMRTPRYSIVSETETGALRPVTFHT
jgi:hypothetical protein